MGDNCDNDDDSDGRYDYLVSNINFFSFFNGFIVISKYLALAHKINRPEHEILVCKKHHKTATPMMMYPL